MRAHAGTTDISHTGTTMGSHLSLILVMTPSWPTDTLTALMRKGSVASVKVRRVPLASTMVTDSS